MSAPLQPAPQPYASALRILTMLYQERGLCDALRELPADKSWVFTRGVIRMEIHPVTELHGKTDGRLLNITDGSERIAVGVLLGTPDAGVHFVLAETNSLDKMKDAPVDPAARQALQDKLVFGLTEQLSLRWPPCKSFQYNLFEPL